jgi:hypothetical protein
MPAGQDAQNRLTADTPHAVYSGSGVPDFRANSARQSYVPHVRREVTNGNAKMADRLEAPCPHRPSGMRASRLQELGLALCNLLIQAIRFGTRCTTFIPGEMA